LTAIELNGSVSAIYKKDAGVYASYPQKNLIALRLLASDEQLNSGMNWAFWVMFSLPMLVGSFQLVGGIMQHRPVGFLIWMFVISFVGAFVVPLILGKQRLTNMGQLVLQNLQRQIRHWN